MGALPSLPALGTLFASSMGSEGAVALAATLLDCPRLHAIEISGWGLDAQAKAALRAAAASAPRSAERPEGLTIYMW